MTEPQGAPNQPTADDALHRLERLVGDWTVEAITPDGSVWPGRTTFAWHDSGAHLVQRGASDLPGAPSTVAVIGCDGADGTYHQLYSDDRGVCRVYAMTLDDGEWTLHRDGAPFSQRFTGTFSSDGSTIAGRWERADDGATYRTDFELIFRRRAPERG